MINNTLFEEMSSRFAQLAATTPVAEFEKNARALLAGMFERLDLVSREEFEVQREVLSRTREKLTALETRVAELEARNAK